MNGLGLVVGRCADARSVEDDMESSLSKVSKVVYGRGTEARGTRRDEEGNLWTEAPLPRFPTLFDEHNLQRFNKALTHDYTHICL